MKKEKENQKKLIDKLIFITLLIISFGYYKYYNDGKIHFLNPNMNENIIKIFISVHKDFKNYKNNPVYKIIADEKSELKDKYNLNILYANERKLNNKRISYSEMRKLYYIYQMYLNNNISSKYIGFNHYRRYFDFGDNIPDLDYIFNNYDVILNKKLNIHIGIREQYCQVHICSNYDQVLDIIKETKPEYYETAIKVSNYTKMYICNLFIMKTKDFYNYCKFMFDILFEFDKRNNFTSDKEVLNYTKRLYYKNISESNYQSRIEAFLSERLSNIFYAKNFKKIKTFNMKVIE